MRLCDQFTRCYIKLSRGALLSILCCFGYKFFSILAKEFITLKNLLRFNFSLLVGTTLNVLSFYKGWKTEGNIHKLYAHTTPESVSKIPMASTPTVFHASSLGVLTLTA